MDIMDGVGDEMAPASLKELRRAGEMDIMDRMDAMNIVGEKDGGNGGT